LWRESEENFRRILGVELHFTNAISIASLVFAIVYEIFSCSSLFPEINAGPYVAERSQ